MSLHSEWLVDNAGQQEKWFNLECDRCGEIMCCSWPRVDTDDGSNYCGDCALLLGFINGFDFCKQFMYAFGSLVYFSEYVNGREGIIQNVSIRQKQKGRRMGKQTEETALSISYFGVLFLKEMITLASIALKKAGI